MDMLINEQYVPRYLNNTTLFNHKYQLCLKPTNVVFFLILIQSVVDFVNSTLRNSHVNHFRV